jgi:hypothetical protein
MIDCLVIVPARQYEVAAKSWEPRSGHFLWPEFLTWFLLLEFPLVFTASSGNLVGNIGLRAFGLVVSGLLEPCLFGKEL